MYHHYKMSQFKKYLVKDTIGVGWLPFTTEVTAFARSTCNSEVLPSKLPVFSNLNVSVLFLQLRIFWLLHLCWSNTWVSFWGMWISLTTTMTDKRPPHVQPQPESAMWGTCDWYEQGRLRVWQGNTIRTECQRGKTKRLSPCFGLSAVLL